MILLSGPARFLTILAVAIALVGCETTPRKTFENVGKVGVVSLFGDFFYTVKYQAFLGETRNVNAISDWHLGGYTQSIAVEMLNQYGTAETVSLEFARPQILARYFDPSPGLFGERFDYDAVAATIEKAARDVGADTYLTIEPFDGPPSAPRLVGGLGFYKNDRIWLQQSCFYSMIKIVVRKVGEAGGYAVGNRSSCIETDIEWQPYLREMDDSTQRLIESGFKSILATELQAILYTLGFFPKVKESG
ncbi:MAG: hypothetical protein GY791_07915 [Alphaproteobacteria bacterium]|nr:hypothetical protein [Alphaproteobacteria bacterium]